MIYLASDVVCRKCGLIRKLTDPIYRLAIYQFDLSQNRRETSLNPRLKERQRLRQREREGERD